MDDADDFRGLPFSVFSTAHVLYGDHLASIREVLALYGWLSCWWMKHSALICVYPRGFLVLLALI